MLPLREKIVTLKGNKKNIRGNKKMNPLKPSDIFGPFGRFRRDNLRGDKLVASRKIDEDNAFVPTSISLRICISQSQNRRIDEWKDIKKKENSQ